MSQDTADFEELINNLDSQAFISQIPNMRGMGGLSENEGKKLASSLQSLTLRVSKERFLENLAEIERLMLKARTNVANRNGVPETIPDTPAVETDVVDIEALINQYAPEAP